jgi:hypothetical protein
VGVGVGVVGVTASSEAGAGPLDGSTTLIGASALTAVEGAASGTPPVTEGPALESAGADPVEELFEVQAAAPASRPAVIPSRATRRPQCVSREVVLIECPYGSCAGSMPTPGDAVR